MPTYAGARYAGRRYGGTRIYKGNELLDRFDFALAAYSLRRLKASATRAIQVRRSSDNTTMDIGFSSQGLLDTSALMTFVGSGSGFVTTWYDQSGFLRHITQTTDANQPRIVNAGVLDTVTGNVPSVYFNRTSYYLSRNEAFMWANGNASISACMQGIAATDARFICEGSSASVNPIYCPFQSSGSAGSNTKSAGFIRDDANVLQFSNTSPGSVDAYNSMPHVITAIDTGTNLKHYIDGSLGLNSNYARSTNTLNRFALGALLRGSPLSYFGGNISECIIHARPLSDADRAIIQASQTAFFKP